MSARSTFIGIVTLLRLVLSRRAREEFEQASMELAATNHEAMAQLARMRREPGSTPLLRQAWPGPRHDESSSKIHDEVPTD